MQFYVTALIRNAAVACLLWAALPHTALATGAEPATDPQADLAPCAAAAAAGDADRIIAICGALIDNEKTQRADRIKALIARGAAYDRKEMIDAPSATTIRCCGSIRRLPIFSMPVASSGAGRATGRARSPISAPPSS